MNTKYLEQFDELVRKTTLVMQENWATASQDDLRRFLDQALTAVREERNDILLLRIKQLEEALYEKRDRNLDPQKSAPLNLN